MKQSLGFVECDGLSSAVVAADRMLKTAAVKLEGMHETMGIGWVTVKIGGDLSAVQAAVDEVKATMPKIIMGSVVLGMPAEGLDKLGQTDIGIFLPKPPKKPTPPQNGAAAKEEAKKSNPDDTMNASANKELQDSDNSVSLKDKETDDQIGGPSSKEKESPDEDESLKENETAKNSNSDNHKNAKMKAEAKKDDSSSSDDKQVVTCNLCGDPKCPRKKGEPHKKCIHYDELKKNK